jgi:thymidine phosphorylase
VTAQAQTKRQIRSVAQSMRESTAATHEFQNLVAMVQGDERRVADPPRVVVRR